MSQNILFVIAGPTATGKTEFAKKLAGRINGELVNTDSVQVYKHLNIGSNKGFLKPARSEIILDQELPVLSYEGSPIAIHLIDFLAPDRSFNVNDYQTLAYGVIDDIAKRGKFPILVGGSGLYISSIVSGFTFSKHRWFSTFLRNIFSRMPDFILFHAGSILKLNSSDRRNRRRIISALSRKANKTNRSDRHPKFKTFIIYPIFKREELYKDIERRVDEMFEQGLLDEAKYLINTFKRRLSPTIRNASGYKQIFDCLETQNFDLEYCKERVKQAHRNYAKRQITWFERTNKEFELHKLDFRNEESISKATELAFHDQ